MSRYNSRPPVRGANGRLRLPGKAHRSFNSRPRVGGEPDVQAMLTVLLQLTPPCGGEHEVELPAARAMELQLTPLLGANEQHLESVSGQEPLQLTPRVGAKESRLTIRHRTCDLNSRPLVGGEQHRVCQWESLLSFVGVSLFYHANIRMATRFG